MTELPFSVREDVGAIPSDVGHYLSMALCFPAKEVEFPFPLLRRHNTLIRSQGHLVWILV